jgi:glycosyltransferase involved in cell wall biosynthesis
VKLLLDLQGCQSGGSRNRGIGRYSLALAQAIARHGGAHEIWLLLNGGFPETVEPLREAFAGLVPPERIAVFQVPPGCAAAHADPWRVQAAEAIRQYAIDAIAPDVVHVSSLFEGMVDDCVTFVPPAAGGPPVAVTLYDLIPLLNAERYLSDPRTKAWYMGKIASLARADLLLAISESAGLEARDHLPGRKGVVTNISCAADPRFVPEGPRDAAARYGLGRPYVMYTGGIDWRKNIEGLIRAYAMLPKDLREAHQLALVCHAEPQARAQLLRLAAQSGLRADDVVMTGFVSDDDLAALYRGCALFVFPSLHEGFGLPALEAMMCGAPVIGSDCSSIPEVIGRADALFDPQDDAAIAAAMRRGLEDAAFRESLRQHGALQAQRFSWDITGQKALREIEALHARTERTPAVQRPARPRLAMVSPIPPAQSGIADYCAELLPVLAGHYDIEIVCDQAQVALPAAVAGLPVRSVAWFDAHAGEYDRIVYQFGNSEFHAHMFGLLRRHPGVVVLHDFFLSGVLHWMETRGHSGAFADALLGSHGTEGVDFERAQGRGAAIFRYPLNRFVIERATGVIVHSDYSLRAAASWYGPATATHWRRIPHLRVLPQLPDRDAARQALGLESDDFLVCSFGHVGETKQNHRLLETWLQSPLARDTRCRLVLVGRNPADGYGERIAKLVARGEGRISITGFADRPLFERYLAAADAAVQLRGLSRGETSGTVLDCLAYGVPLVANANGSNAEYPHGVIHRLEDEYSDEDLLAALERLRADPQERRRLGEAGRAWVAANHDPRAIALAYREAIEAAAAQPHGTAYWNLVDRIAALGEPPREADLLDVAAAIAATGRPAG